MTWVLIILLLVAFAAPFVIERMKPKMSAKLREDAPGEFAKLSDGLTHFCWNGPEDGPVLVCIHGLTTPAYVWDQLTPGLTKAGFRVLTYDLYGRGYSDRATGAQDRNFFLRQLGELLQDQGIDEPVTLMGYSMGGSIATVFAAENPAWVNRVVLMAPAGMQHQAGGLAEFARKTPVIGDWLMLAFGGRRIRDAAWAADGPAAVVQAYAERMEVELGFRGYVPAVLASQRGILAETLEAEHRELAASGLPVAAVWGQDDAVIPMNALGRLTEWNRRARHRVIPGAGHGLVYTHADEVLTALGEALTD